MNSANFSSSNRMLFAVIKDMKKEGLDKSQHYPAISEMDLAKIKLPTSFDLNDPAQLQEKVFFDIQYNFGRRGRENLRFTQKHSYRWVKIFINLRTYGDIFSKTGHLFNKKKSIFSIFCVLNF